MTATRDERSIRQLMNDFAEQTARLVRTEATLAAREMAGKARRGGIGAGALGAAGVLACYAGGLLLAAVVLGLAPVMPAWTAALVVGLALLLPAALLALLGKSALRQAMPPVPDETITRVREDIGVVAEGARHDQNQP
jgi:hypothetical protein